MITRLPKWIEYGAFVMALVAGSVNAVALLGFQHQAVSHLSGTATLLGRALLTPDPATLLYLIGMLLSFTVGAAISGALLTGRSLRIGRFYDVLLFIEALLLITAMLLLLNQNTLGNFFASVACGLQNALATKHSGAVVRTTHLTGIFTDLGIMLGSTVRGKGGDRRKVMLFLIIVVGFISGGTLGAWLFSLLGFQALLIPALLCVALSVMYRAYYIGLIRARRH
ncbi:YoaK family protein [Marinomonas algarum]|uniref:DUF1275 domain-containing protein n=1 Tax=Marinomonas algarum TaxID=2883105 RepID=A0A9X1LCA4_9GAMM|nr:YoaK family protein [Marinomonas algarum]MCB5161819.1 DUF1275 domain-containing protein [Marinomonas algarum]